MSAVSGSVIPLRICEVTSQARGADCVVPPRLLRFLPDHVAQVAQRSGRQAPLPPSPSLDPYTAVDPGHNQFGGRTIFQPGATQFGWLDAE